MKPIVFRSMFCLVAALVVVGGSGCAPWAPLPWQGQGPSVQLDNPLFVPVNDHQFAWNQIVDSVDDTFRIEREQQIHQVGGVLTEGRIETFPQNGASLLEPWRNDSTPGFERLHASLQTIRRQATLLISPAEGGYFVNVLVVKELEDPHSPQSATAGGAMLRHDGSLVSGSLINPRETLESPGWIAQGRDISLEQAMLSDIYSRLTDGNQPVQLSREGAQ